VEVKAPPPPANKSPHAEFHVSCTDLTCTFTDQSRDDDGSIVSRVWNYGDGSPESSTPSHTYATGGNYTVMLTVTDNGGASDSRAHTANPASPPPPNSPPTAEFGSSCTDLTCQFTDQSTDDGDVTSWNWNFGDGSTSPQRNPSHTYAVGNTYDVKLTVTDNDAATGEVTHQVTVTAPPPPNQDPTAAFDPPGCTTGEACQFTDGSNDSDGSVVGWDWDFDDSGAKSTEKNPVHTFNASGTYDVKLRVTDDDGAQSDEVQHEVVVTDPAPPPPPPSNEAPTARIGSISCTGMDCSYTDDSTDRNGTATIASWSWVFGDGESSDLQNPTHSYADGGTYPVTLTVTDNGGLSGADATEVTVPPPSAQSRVSLPS
jgi:PKD repeat protein